MDFDQKLRKDPASVIAHDLKVPLGAIKGYVELVQKLGDLNPNQTKYLERALLVVDKMTGIIDAWLDLARLEGTEGLGQLVDCDLGRIINGAVDLVEHAAAQQGLSLHVSLPAGLETVRGDPTRLGQVVSNLLSNAIKFSQDGGAVWVEAVLEPDAVRVSVRDTGEGIHPDDLPHIFDRLYRGRRRDRTEGVGLGLAIAHMIVMRHGGDIWAESVLGEGSTFSFRLPRSGGQRDGIEQDARDARAGRDGDDSAPDVFSETADETPDAVDDDLQESSSALDTDSSSDLV